MPGGLARELGRWLLEWSENVPRRVRQPMPMGNRPQSALPVGRRPEMERRDGRTTERRNVGNRAESEFVGVTPAEGAVGAAKVRDVGNGQPCRGEYDQGGRESFPHVPSFPTFRLYRIATGPHRCGPVSRHEKAGSDEVVHCPTIY